MNEGQPSDVFVHLAGALCSFNSNTMGTNLVFVWSCLDCEC